MTFTMRNLRAPALMLLLLPLVTANSGADFSNNLFSDIAPILALFGEQFAKQFMSQSLGWLDHIIMAMAPLGILTAMVSAIRVGGPSWLRAVTGRARENKATVELELMTSTSHEVGEVWNGQAIVRTLGNPEIQQLVFLKDVNGEGHEYGLYSMPEAENEGYLCCKTLEDPLLEWFRRLWGPLLRRLARKKPSPSDIETGGLGEIELPLYLSRETTNYNEDRLSSKASARAPATTLRNNSESSESISIRQSTEITRQATARYTPSLVHSQSRGVSTSADFNTVNSANIRKGLPSYSSKPGQEKSADYGITRTQDLKTAPSISLNLHHGSKTKDLCFAAFCGIILQSGVLVLGGLATYHPVWKWRFLNDGSLAVNYAYPMLAIGTILLVIGVLICSAVVEKGTTEKKWVAGKKYESKEKKPSSAIYRMGNRTTEKKWVAGKKYESKEKKPFSAIYRMGNIAGILGRTEVLCPKKKLRARILWLQKSHTVSDQSFDAYVIVAHEVRDIILTSQRTQTSTCPTKDRRRLLGSNYFRRVASNKMELFTVVGIGISLVGFILQFQSLRGLNWSISIAQLVATFIMTTLRAWVRRGLIIEPSAHQVLEGYEMDWLAKRMVENPHFWDEGCSERGAHTGHLHLTHLHRKKESNRRQDENTGAPLVPSGIRTGDSLDQPLISAINQQAITEGVWKIGETDPENTILVNNAQKAVRIRQRLGYLTRWSSKASKPSIAVARSVATVMKKLSVKPPENASVFCWYLDVRFMGEVERLKFTVSKPVATDWVVDATEIDAAISFWSYYVYSHQKNEDHTNTKFFDDNDWLQKSKKFGRQTKRILGGWRINNEGRLESDGLELDLKLWVGGGVDIQSLKLKVPSDDEDLCIGFSNVCDHDDSIIFVPSQAPLEQLLAQHIFTAFMWAITQHLPDDLLQRKDTIVKGPVDLNTPTFSQLENKTLVELTNTIEKSGLGSREEILLCIIPPLSRAKKLPVDAVVDHVRQNTRQSKANEDWERVISWHCELVNFCNQFGRGHPINHRAAGTLIELFQVVEKTVELWQHQKRRGEEVDALSGLQKRLLETLKTLDCEAVFHLMELMKFRHRPHSICNVLKGFHQELSRPRTEMHNFFGHLGFFLWISDTPDSPEFDRIVKVQQQPNLDPEVAEPQPQDTREDDTWLSSWLDLEYSFWAREIKDQVNAVDIFNCTPLHYAALLGQVNITKQLLEMKADKNAIDLAEYSPLHYASERGHNLTVDILLEGASLIDAQGWDGMSPLHLAAMCGRNKTTGLLLRKNARVDIQDHSRRTPLHWAAQYDNYEVVNRLLQYKAQVDARDDYERTPLHLATFGQRSETPSSTFSNKLNTTEFTTFTRIKEEESTDIPKTGNYSQTVKALLKYNAGKNAVDRDERTSLHLASQINNIEMVKLLLNSNLGGEMDVDLKDIYGKTALQLAIENGHQGVAVILFNHSFHTNEILSHQDGENKRSKEKRKTMAEAMVEALETAVKFGREDILEILKDKVLDILLGENPSRYEKILANEIWSQRQFGILALLLNIGVTRDYSKQSKSLALFKRAIELKLELMIDFLTNVIVLNSRNEATEAAEIAIQGLEWAQFSVQSIAMIDRALSYKMHSSIKTFKTFKTIFKSFEKKFRDQNIVKEADVPVTEETKDIARLRDATERMNQKIPYFAARLSFLVLDSEEFWVSTTIEKDEEIQVDEHDKDAPYIVSSKIVAPLRKIIFTMTSHDQGWGGDEDMEGEYQGSWTWFEAGALEKDGATSPPKRMSIQRNVRAQWNSRQHIVTWRYDDPNLLREKRDWMSSIKPGDNIGVYPKALFPGWVNHVEYVKLEVFCTWEIG